MDAELIQAIGDVVRQEVAPLRSDIRELKQGQLELKRDVAELRSNVAELRSDVDNLKVSHDILSGGLVRMEHDIARMGSLFDGHKQLDRRVTRLENHVGIKD